MKSISVFTDSKISRGDSPARSSAVERLHDDDYDL